MPRDTYTMLETSTLTGISKPSLRNYSKTYARYLSTGATPEKGEARVFTADDLRVLRFAYSLTETGSTHDQVLQRLADGELDTFTWRPEDAESANEQTQLLPPEQTRMLAVLFEEYRQRDAAAAARELELRDRIERLQAELGETRGRLAERGRWHPPAWWKWLFGTRDI